MDEKLLAAIKEMGEGKESGFNVVYSKTYEFVYSRAMLIMKNNEDAMDLTQIVFIEAFRSISSLDNPEALFGWLKGITYRQGMKIYRKKNDVLLDEEGEGIFETLESTDIERMPELASDQKQTASIIKEIVDELPVPQKVAIIAYYFDNMSVGEIAAQEGCSEGTIKSRLNYARKYIKERVEEKEKKGGYKLHAFTLPLLWWALRDLLAEPQITVSSAQAMYNIICGKLGLQASAIAGVGVTTIQAGTTATATSAASSSGAAAAAGVAAGATKAAGLGAGAKALIIAGAILGGGGIAGGAAGIAIAVYNSDEADEAEDKPSKKPDKDEDFDWKEDSEHKDDDKPSADVDKKDKPTNEEMQTMAETFGGWLDEAFNECYIADLNGDGILEYIERDSSHGEAYAEYHILNCEGNKPVIFGKLEGFHGYRVFTEEDTGRILIETAMDGYVYVYSYNPAGDASVDHDRQLVYMSGDGTGENMEEYIPAHNQKELEMIATPTKEDIYKAIVEYYKD